MSPSTNPSGRRGVGSRNRALAAVGGAVALGALAWYAYTAWTTSEGQGGSSSGSSTTSSSSKGSLAASKNGHKPSLSISLPPTFSRSPKTLRLLAQLLASVSTRYTVTLIVPSSSSTTLHASFGSANGHVVEQTLDTVKQMSELLSNVQGFDVRRIVEYSSEDGRLSLARALACDGHCEVMLQAYNDDGEQSDALFDNDDDDDDFEDDGETKTEDGDRTPRASSPAPHMRPVNVDSASNAPRLAESTKEEDGLVTALEHYHAEVARIRKSSGLLIFILLPVPQKTIKRTAKNEMWSLDVEDVLKPFLMPGQRDLSARVPGVKVIDARIPTATTGRKVHHHTSSTMSNGTFPATFSSAEHAWTEAAQRIGQLAGGWS